MEVKVIAFGKIADITAARTWMMQVVRSTHELRERLEKIHPELQGMHFLIALDKKIVTADTPLTPGVEVALLPPFSGG